MGNHVGKIGKPSGPMGGPSDLPDSLGGFGGLPIGSEPAPTNMQDATIHTDGSCFPNPGGRGGWAAVIEIGCSKREISGSDPGPTTSNRMEIRAAIEALNALEYPCRVTIITDSQYLQKSGTAWIKLWKKRGWMTHERTPVKNQDLWIQLDAAMVRHRVKWVWEKGHVENHEANMRCDALANNRRIGGYITDLLLNHDATDNQAEARKEQTT